MARDFSKNTSNYMGLGVGTLGPIVNGSAFLSFHCWANVDTIDSGTNDNALFAILIGGNLAAFTARINGSGATKLLRVGGRSGTGDGFQARNATSSFTTGTWHACGGVLDFAGDAITPYFNGVSEGGGAVTFANSTYTDSSISRSQQDAIGGQESPAPSTASQTDGRIAELCIWFGSRAVTDDEFAGLADSVSPKLIAPDLGRIYFPLIGQGSNERDYIRGLTGTITGTVSASAHPRVYYPSAQILQFPSAAVAASPKWPSSLALTGTGF